MYHFYSVIITVLAFGGAPARAESVSAPALKFSDCVGREAELAEFRYIYSQLGMIDPKGVPTKTDGWDNIVEAEWPFFALTYFGYAGCNLAGKYPDMAGQVLPAVKWALELIRTPRISGFAKPHFGEPFGEKIETPSALVHGHFLCLALRYRSVSKDPMFDPVSKRVAASLVRAYEADPQGILPSYPGMWWPTDNLPAFAGLKLYAKALSVEVPPVHQKWLQSMKSHYLDKDTGLMCAYVSPKDKRPAHVPRGVAVMFSIPFLVHLDADFAANQYRQAKKHLVRRTLGLAAVREFVAGKEARPDVDSGPLAFGFGPSASGFAIAAAAAMGDIELLDALVRSSTLAGAPELKDGKLRFKIVPVVGQAIMLFGKTLPRDGDPPVE